MLLIGLSFAVVLLLIVLRSQRLRQEWEAPPVRAPAALVDLWDRNALSYFRDIYLPDHPSSITVKFRFSPWHTGAEASHRKSRR
jgi:hypothetical protein